MQTDPEALTISDVAARTGLTTHTLRYYEDLGLIDDITRAVSGHRRYRASDLEWIEFLKRLRRTGMPIQEMRQFAQLRRDGPATAARRQRLLEDHRSRIRSEIAALNDNIAAINNKIGYYAALATDNEETP